MTRIRLSACALAIALASMAPLHGVQREQNPYDAGKYAFEQKEFAEAARLMTQAASQDRRERAPGFFGSMVRREGYFPYYYLGAAQFALEHCALAIDAWETSWAAGESIKNNAFKTRMTDGFAHCENKQYLRNVPRDEVYAKVKNLIDQQNQVRVRINPLKSSPAWTSEMQSQQDRADADFGPRLYEVYEGRFRPDFEELRSAAQRSLDGMLAVEVAFHTAAARPANREPDSPAPDAGATVATVLPAEILAEGENALKKLNERLTGFSGRAATLAGAENARAEIRKYQGGLKRLRTRFDAARGVPDLKALEGVVSELRGLSRTFDRVDRELTTLAGGPQPHHVGDQLVAATSEFLGGRHHGVVDALSDDMVPVIGEKARPHFYAIRAAAHLALYDRGGRTDAERMKKVQADVEQCLQLDPKFAPDPAVFSERFRRLFEDAPRPLAP